MSFAVMSFAVISVAVMSFAVRNPLAAVSGSGRAT
jgi:hypothetical protein